MKNTYITFVFLAFLGLSSCSKDGDNNSQAQADPIAQFSSQLCTGINGPTAVYWDYSHGLPTPLSQIPTVANPGAQFIHSQYPALGFTMPQGFAAQEVLDNATAAIGVNVIRNDNQVVWRYLPTLRFPGNLSNEAVVGVEVDGLMAFYNVTGSPTVRCSETQTTTNGTLITTFGSRLIEFGNVRASIWINTHYEQTLDFTFVAISVSSAPIAEFDAQVMDTFLPLSWQLLVIDDNVRDSDLDGTPDNQDNFPFDPTRQ